MNIHVLAVCGTFMGGMALLARAAGHRVTGSDRNVYPPMSDLLESEGIRVVDGYDPKTIPEDTDLVIVGNALSRGNPAVEYVLNQKIPYTSGPQWLGEKVLADRRVLAVAGTHGKTTTACVAAWMLESAGLDPGFLIGGVPGNFPVSARTGGGDWFVVEADEYDTAFFDKRSKFVHYHPEVLILNNLEFDHADIFPDLAAIQRQFHHLIRTVPGRGRIVYRAGDRNLATVLEQGCWTETESFGLDGASSPHWRGREAGSQQVALEGPDRFSAAADWSMSGRHNLENAVAAAAAVAATGVAPDRAWNALSTFRLPRRRMEIVEEVGGITVLDDFAHHPTAMQATLAAVRARWPGRRLIVAFEPRSNSMRLGVHARDIAPALAEADAAWVAERPNLSWDPSRLFHGTSIRVAEVGAMLETMIGEVQAGDVVVFMSNGSFDGAPRRFADALSEKVS